MSVIDSIIKKAKAHYGDDVTVLDDIDEFFEAKCWISSGIPDIDLFLHTFGLPGGKIIEVSGNPQSGKTSFSLHCALACQRQRGIVSLISSERRDNKVYAKNIGIDTTRILLHRTKTIEDSFEYIKSDVELLRNESDDIPILIIWDSLGGTPTKAELAADADKNFMAVAAKVIKQNLRVVTQLIDDANITFLINNQTYSKIGQMFGKKTTSYGGDAVKFHSSIRLEVTKVETLKEKINEKKYTKIGQKVRFELLKSDYSNPFRVIDVDLLFGYGYIPSKTSLEFGVDQGFLERWGKGGYQVVKLPKYKWKSQRDYYRLMMEDKNFRNIFSILLTKEVHKFVADQRGV